MIWEFWRESQPVVYHYLLVSGRDRYYAARLANVGNIIYSASPSPDRDIVSEMSLDPGQRMICFPGRVGTTSGPLDDTPGGNVDMPAGFKIGQFRPPATHVRTSFDFQKDVVFFGSDSPSQGQFLFLCNQNGTPRPQDIKDDHWCHHIRQLAIFAPDIDSPSVHELDRHVLLQLKRLKKVFLVVEGWRLKLADYISIQDLEEFAILLSKTTMDRDVYARFSQMTHRAWDFRNDLLRILQESNRRDIAVELMIDTTKKARCF